MASSQTENCAGRDHDTQWDTKQATTTVTQSWTEGATGR